MLCGLSQNMYELAAFRAIQGIGAGGLMSLALAIIGDIVPPRERAKYQGFFLAVFGTASVIGPILGGFFAGADTILGVDGWRWVFYINVPIGIAAMIVVARVLHLPHQRTDHRIDWPGAVALIVGLVPLLTVAEQGRDWGWDSPRAFLCYAVGAIGLVAFVLAERAYKDEALLPLRLFRNRTVAVGSISSTILGMAMFGGLMTVPLYLQIVKGSTATLAGLQMIPFVVGIMAGSILSGQLIARTGRYRIFPIIGSTLMAAALGAVRDDRRGHPALADHADHGADGPRPGRQHAADDHRGAERGVPARDRRGDQLGDVLPLDGRHAGHGDLPVRAVQRPAGQDRVARTAARHAGVPAGAGADPTRGRSCSRPRRRR